MSGVASSTSAYPLETIHLDGLDFATGGEEEADAEKDHEERMRELAQDLAHGFDDMDDLLDDTNELSVEGNTPRTRAVGRANLDFQFPEKLSEASVEGNPVRRSSPSERGGPEPKPRTLVAPSNAESETVARLEVLYDARGREIERLRAQIGDTTQSYAREVRSLRHQLAVLSGEKKALSDSLESARELLGEKRNENTELRGELEAVQVKLRTLTEAKEQLTITLTEKQSTIRHLENELANYQSTETISQLKESHKKVLDGLRAKYEQETEALVNDLEVARTALEEKTEEVAELQKELRLKTREYEIQLVEKTDTISHLSRAVRENQGHITATLVATPTDDWSSKHAAYEREIQTLKEKGTAVTKENAELKEQLTGLKRLMGESVMKANQEKAAMVENVRSTAETVHQQALQKMESEILKQKEAEVKNIKQELKEIYSALDEARNLYIKECARTTDLEDEIRTLEDKLEETEGRLREIQAEGDSPALKSVRKDLARMEEELRLSEEKGKRLQAEVEKTKRFEAELEKVEGILREKNEEVQRLKESLEQKQCEFQELMKSQNSETERELRNARSTIQRLSAEKSRLEEERRSVSEEAGEEVKNAQATIQRLTKEKEQVEVERRKWSEELKREVEKLKSEAQRLVREKEIELEEEREKWRDFCREFYQKIEELKKVRERDVADFKELEEKLRKKISDCKNRYQELKENWKKQKAKVKELKAAIKEHLQRQQQFGLPSADADQAVDEIQMVKNEILNLRQSLADMLASS